MILNNTLKRKWFIFSLIYLLVSPFIFSQDLKFKNFSREEGLSSVNVKTIFQDSKNFIWIGTQDGLNRYDGYHFKNFKNNINDKNTISSADINCIVEDKTGLLFIGTNGRGLSVYNPITETFKNFSQESNGISNNNILTILNLNKTQLLIGTGDGICLFDKNTNKTTDINVKNIVKEGKVYVSSIYKDHKNNIWVAMPKYGLFKFNTQNNSLTEQIFPPSILKNEKQFQDHAIMSIAQYENKLYCATFSGGIITFDLNKNTFDNRISFLEINPKLNEMRNIIIDNNNLWIATLGGLIQYNLYTNSYKISTHNPLDKASIAGDEMLSIFKDNQHNIWVGTESNGLSVNFKSSQNFTHYNKNQLKGNDVIYCFLETQNGLIWIGTENGLYSFNKTTKEFLNKSEILKKHDASLVWSLMEDENNNILISTYNAGVILLNSKTGVSNKILPDSLQADNFHKIIQDNKKNILIATYKYGLIKLQKNNLKPIIFNTSAGLNTNIIKDIYEDKEGNLLWLSTQDGGINILKIDSNSKIENVKLLTHQLDKNSISSDLVYSVIKDKIQKNIYWIATNNGLNKFDGKTFTVLTEQDGLPNNCIYSILQDNDGKLWLTTNNGLSCYDPKTNKFINYNTSNGIQSKEFNQGAAYICKDGYMLVGGMNGFNYFNPKTIFPNTYKPNIYIYEYSKLGEEIKTDTSLLLKKHFNFTYKDRYFTFEVVALDFSSPENIKYMYMLEGYNNTWSVPNTNRYISYNNLPGGNYTLKIKATNSMGVWNETPLEISIKVTPPWYKTILFYVLSFITIIGSVIGFFMYRNNTIKKENRLLENKVEERTKELAGKNRDITSSIEYAKRIQEAILPSQDLIFSQLKNAFIIYKPKDIVSGDFYWFGEKNNWKIVAIVDCTGHGVPGAFMSMIGHNLLNQIIAENGVTDPGLILDELHKGVQAALKQGHNAVDTNDGMDVSLLAINDVTGEYKWAGAFRSLIIINENGDFNRIDGNKYPVGGAQLDFERIFTTHTPQLIKNDSLYMFTDGYADQFGGLKGKKLMVKQFHDYLKQIYPKTALEQKLELEMVFNNWKGEYEQVDDVLVFGIKL